MSTEADRIAALQHYQNAAVLAASSLPSFGDPSMQPAEGQQEAYFRNAAAAAQARYNYITNYGPIQN